MWQLLLQSLLLFQAPFVRAVSPAFWRRTEQWLPCSGPISLVYFEILACSQPLRANFHTPQLQPSSVTVVKNDC
jgi:hypothetical protein